MPNVGHFLDLLEAISRRDWRKAEEIGKNAADYERKKKHYTAAHRILEAVDVLSQTTDDKIGTVASPSVMPQFAPPDVLTVFQNRKGQSMPILNKSVQTTVDQLISEWRNETKLKEKGVEPRRSVLFHGPPGCGKTLLADYIARQLKLKLFVVRFDSLLSSFLGETGQNLRKVFEYISSNRCALLIDEIDAIAKIRDDRNDLGELKRVVISLLQNIDIGSNRSLLLAATNHPHVLDLAIWRRFEVVIGVDYPGEKEREEIVKRYLSDEVATKIIDLIVGLTKGRSGADIEFICNDAKRKQLLGEDLDLSEAVVLSLIEDSRRTNYSNSESTNLDESTVTKLVLSLKSLDEKKYSFGELERLLGIPKSTLHHKYKTALETA